MWKKTIVLDYQSKEAIKSAQITALQKQIEYLSSNSPYYKELFQQNKIDATSINSLSDLEQLPTTSKKDLERENKSFLCVPKNEIAEYVTTSGTLGMPITIALTKNDLRRLSYNEKRSLEIVGISAEDTIQITTTLDKMFMAGMAYYTGAISLGAAVIRSGIGNPGAQWENISRFKASVVIAVPVC
jgi:phenylacetate-CoA ligase